MNFRLYCARLLRDSIPNQKVRFGPSQHCHHHQCWPSTNSVGDMTKVRIQRQMNRLTTRPTTAVAAAQAEPTIISVVLTYRETAM